MRVLIDHCLDWRLKRALPGHDVSAVYEIGWEATKNGRLLTLAEAKFDVLLTVDRGIEYQQNMTGRALAIITLRADSNRLQDTLPMMAQVAALLPTAQAGQVYLVAAEQKDTAEPEQE